MEVVTGVDRRLVTRCSK